ncbi:unnamed protein product [Auanema sp. JU1783]|nr:unnamed protein product [Auanema sp. JU1783]
MISRIQPRNFLRSNGIQKSFSTSSVRSSEPKLSVAVEKVSLSRGLSMNKFEKDFLIYPEYNDTDDLKNIEGFTDVLRQTLEVATKAGDVEKAGCLTDDIKYALEKNQICSTFVPSDYEGLGMCRKDLAHIFQELSIDWNIFANVSTVYIASQLLILYGNEEQKTKYLPLIANGKCRPAITLANLKGNQEMLGECVSSTGSSMLLSVKDVPMLASENANLLFVFAKNKNHLTKSNGISCILVDTNNISSTGKLSFKREDSTGLKGTNVAMVSLESTIDSSLVLGDGDQGLEIIKELTCSGRFPLAAATIGHARRLLTKLSVIANRTPSSRDDNSFVASDSGAQYVATTLALNLYSLESSLFYLVGLLDEGIPMVADVENALIFKLTRDVLRNCVLATIELGGIRASSTKEQFEKDIRDISTILSLNGEGDIVESTAIATLSTWTTTSHKRITSTLRRLLSNEKTNADLKNPKLSHYIAEHAHPSLQLACQELEFSMSRLNTVISKMVSEQGKNLEQDYGSLEGMVNVLKNQMVMVAVISRASRSYAIGLRNADIELAWATTICTRLSRSNWFELEAMSDYFGLVRFNPSLLNAGRAIFDLGGYKIESPTQRNW